MNKTIKIIDLLNKIANGEEVPNLIKYQCVIGKWNDGMSDYMYNDGAGIFDDFICNLCNELNNEVEIIEEQEEIDIQDIVEPLEVESYECDKTDIRINRETIKKLVQAVKYLDNKLKEK